MDEHSFGLTAKQVTLGQDPPAPVTVLAGGDRIPFVERNLGEKLGPASQVVGRGKDELAGSPLTHALRQSGPTPQREHLHGRR